ncbi:MAG: alpha/beta hydrolase fold domain-containing protein [Isosphaeraceae bacterium]
MSRLGTIFHILAWSGLVAVAVWLARTDHRRFGDDLRLKRGMVLRDRIYREDGARRVALDVYLPEESAQGPRESPRRPGVLAIHGGSWIGGSKSEYGPQFVRLVEHGFVVFAADYKLARPGAAAWPDAFDDLREAVRWIRRHAEEFQVDPERLTALGSGAGGHLAALLGTADAETSDGTVSSRVQAVVSFYGPSDLDELIRHRHLPSDPARVFLGVETTANAALARAVSPIDHVRSDDAPMLLIHGSDDAWTPPEQSRRLAEALGKAGVMHRLIEVTGARHGFELMVRHPETRDLLPDVLAFLETVWQVHLGDLP